MSHFIECDFAKLSEIAYCIASDLKAGGVVCLNGDLGVGKTTLAGMMIKTLVPNLERAPSPTFNLVHIYDTPNFQIWHFDLYRLEKTSDVYNLGIEDALNYGVSIIEWPELIEDILPKEVIRVQIEFAEKSKHRLVKVW